MSVIIKGRTAHLSYRNIDIANLNIDTKLASLVVVVFTNSPTAACYCHVFYQI
jgi:hypothetical protein